jgi:hypothetical protein
MSINFLCILSHPLGLKALYYLFISKLSDIVGGAFEALGLPRELGALRAGSRNPAF